MIFSNKIYKLSSGTNISLYADSADLLNMFVFNNITHKKNITFDGTVRCVNSGDNFNYNKVMKINDFHTCICFDKNISVINNEE